MEIKLVHVTKSFGAKQVIQPTSFVIQSGSLTTLLGPSGCGKTTLLRMIAGLETPDSGEIWFENRCVFSSEKKINIPPEKRGLGFVFQDFALWPHMTVFENVAFGLRAAGKTDKLDEKVKNALHAVQLDDFAQRYPHQLSGGQQQRVAIARSLVNQPRVLLLDEPLGALDLKLRKEMQLELKRLQREMNITFVYVTHDQEEALTMSDTVVVMSGGKIQQIGSPQDIYNEPKNAFVARFIGDSNIVDGVMLRDFYVNFGGHDFTCVDRGFKPNEPVQVVIRPEDVQIVPPSVGMLTGLVREVIFKGVHFEMHVDVEGYEWIIHSTQASQPGELIGMNIGPDEIHIMKRSEV